MTTGIANQQRLARKLHPRTGFMLIVPNIVIACLFGLYLISPNLQAAENVLEGFFFTFTVNAFAVGVSLWSDFGHTVYWDEHGICVRPDSGRFLFRRKSFAAAPYSNIRGIRLHPPPRGVPPRFPLIEIDAPSQTGAPLMVDPYHFTRKSLTRLVESLQRHVSNLGEGDQARATNRLLKLFK